MEGFRDLKGMGMIRIRLEGITTILISEQRSNVPSLTDYFQGLIMSLTSHGTKYGF